MATTANRLLSGVKRRVVVPSNQILLTDEDILAFADDMISSRIVPILESVNQEYFVRLYDQDLIAGQSEYSIPYRAVARGLRELKFMDAQNNLRNVALIPLEDAQVFQSSSLTLGFYFLGDKIRIIPDVPSSISPNQVLKMWYRLPPSQLVTTSNAALVTSVSAPNVVVSSVPTNLVTGASIDFIQGRSGNSIYDIDQTITNISGTTLTFGADVVPSDLVAGDWISLAQTSPVINFIPNEAYSLIESYTAMRVLQALGDFDGLQSIQADISVEEKNLKIILEPRIDGEPTIIINRSGLVRGNKFSQRSWLYGQ